MQGIGDILAPGQKWLNQDRTVVLNITKMMKENAAVAATYGIIREFEQVSRFPIRGEYDPQGWSIAWAVSYWNEEENDHSVGAWAGYAVESGESGRPELIMTRLISHRADPADTTVGFDVFVLESF